MNTAEIMQKIHSGELIMQFDAFPIHQVPLMRPLMIEKLNKNEIKMYQDKVVQKAVYIYFRDRDEIDNWEGIRKFIVVWLNEWYLVRILWENWEGM